jgi:hypothetical protein
MRVMSCLGTSKQRVAVVLSLGAILGCKDETARRPLPEERATVQTPVVGASLWERVDDVLQTKGAAASVKMLETRLKECESRRFDPLLGLSFDNDPAVVAEHVARFYELCSARFQPKALYFEMNGFDINPDRWYFDSFAYEEFEEDPEELDWLSEWSSPAFPQLTLTGMEPAQKVWDWYSNQKGYAEPKVKPAKEVALLLTMVRFAELFEKAHQHPTFPRNVPVLVTAHDFDIMKRFVP